jgi:hypothetical protein
MAVEVVFFRFTCPDCGMGDIELGHLLTVDEIHCMVCLTEDGQHVKLRRWVAEEVDETAASS